MLKSLIDKKYIYYGGSIVLSRGLEYFVLFFAAGYLAKEDYGQLEFYKKIIEVGSSVLAFGFPALILSYTKSKESKIYFYLLSIIFVSALLLTLSIVGLFSYNWFLLILAMGFYGMFFTGGITQSYQMVYLGSNYASVYKIIISLLFYGGVFCLIYFAGIKGEAYLYPAIFLLPLMFLYTYFDFRKVRLELRKLKSYWKLFKKLLISSFTLVVSNFANLMFLYTDILLIKILSNSANTEIADFSFALNVSSVLLIVSTTLVQVDIEKLKSVPNYLYVLNKKIILFSIILASALVVVYYLIINSEIYDGYQNTFTLFLIILLGKVFACMSNAYGTNLTILKKFSINLNINILAFVLNFLICVVAYRFYGLIGLAVTSSCIFVMRFLLFRHYSRIFYSKLKKS